MFICYSADVLVFNLDNFNENQHNLPYGSFSKISTLFFVISIGILIFNLLDKNRFQITALRKVRNFMFKNPIIFFSAAIFFSFFMFVLKLFMSYTELLDPVVSPITSHVVKYELLSRDKFFERYIYNKSTENLIEETIISSTHSYNSEDKKAIIISGQEGNNQLILAKYIASSYYEEYLLIDIRNLLGMSTRVLRKTLHDIVARCKKNNYFVIFHNGGNLILLDKQKILKMNIKGKRKNITHRKKKNKLKEENTNSKIAAFIAIALSTLGDGDIPFIIINDTNEKFNDEKIEQSWIRRAKFVHINNPDTESIKKILKKATEKMKFNCDEEYLNEIFDFFANKLQGCSYVMITNLVLEIQSNYTRYSSIINVNDFIKNLNEHVDNMRNTLKDEKIHLLRSCTKFKPKLVD